MAGYGKNSKARGGVPSTGTIATKIDKGPGAKGSPVNTEKFTQTFSEVGCHLGHGGKKGI